LGKLGFFKKIGNYKLNAEKTTIEEVGVEFVNYCNLKCKWCSLERYQPRKIMDKILLRKLLDNLLEDERFSNVKNINLWQGGETLLHPDFLGMMKTIKEYKNIFTERCLSFPKINLITNGVFLTKELSKDLIDIDIIDFIRVSLDGGSKEKYEDIRKGAIWNDVVKNICDFSVLNMGKIKTGFICIVENTKQLSNEWMTTEFREVLNMFDNVEFRHPHSWRGEIFIDGYNRAFNNSCNFLNKYLIIMPDGNITVCCQDINSKISIGNLYSQDLYSAYISEKRQQMLKLFSQGKRKEVDSCKNCMIP